MRALMRTWIVCVGMVYAGVALAAPSAEAEQRYQLAAKLDDSGEYEKALGIIDQGLAAAPKDLKLLGLKGSVLVKLRDYTDALAVYKLYLEAGATGANRRSAEKIVDNLQWVESTFLDVALANGPADVYLDLKAQGLFCNAAPMCHKAVLPGEYKVIVERAGFERWTGRITIAPGQTAKLAVTLVEKPSLLTVRVSQPDARVTVDGAAYDAPTSVAAGTHQVVVSMAGRVEVRRQVVAHEGKPVELAVALVPVRVEPTRVATRKESSRAGWLTPRRRLALTSVGIGLWAASMGVGFDQLGEQRQRQAKIAYWGAGTAAAVAVVLWLTGAPKSRVAVAPRLGPRSGAVAGVDLAVRF